jgi:DHA3 family tetracycline resistance protein-like MFS transporter
MKNRLLPAELLYYILSAATSLAGTIMFTVTTVYFVQTVGLNPLQLVLVGTVVESTILVFEVPTGVVADTFSRRASIIIGTFIVGLSFILYGVIPFYWAVLVGQVIWGFGYTFTSGATEAWLADEVGEEQVGPIYVRSGQVNRVVELAGSVISVAIASIALNIPLIVGGSIYLLLAFFMLVCMPETNFKPQPRTKTLRGHLTGMAGILKSGLAVVRSKPILLSLLAVEIFMGAASEGFDRLGDAHLLQNFSFPALGSLKPVVWFGILNIAGSIASLIVTALLRRRLEDATRSSQLSARYLLIMNAFSILAVVIFALAGNFYLAVAALLFRGILGAMIYPLYNSWLVQNIEPRTRATVISMVGQSNAFGQIAGGPGVGAIGSAFSIRSAILATSFLSLPVLYLYGRIIHRGKLIPEQAEETLPAEAEI